LIDFHGRSKHQTGRVDFFPILVSIPTQGIVNSVVVICLTCTFGFVKKRVNIIIDKTTIFHNKDFLQILVSILKFMTANVPIEELYFY
jgi:hypothetical protein